MAPRISRSLAAAALPTLRTRHSRWNSSSASSLPSLPEDWTKILRYTHSMKNRVLVNNPTTARHVVANFFKSAERDGKSAEKDVTNSHMVQGMWKPKSKGREGKVIVEAYAGPGSLTRALLEYPPSIVKRVIALEESEMFLPYLRELEKADPRLTVFPTSGFLWSSYKEIEDAKLLDDVAKHPLEEVHPQLHFMCHLPLSGHGEQLIAQFLRLIPQEGWLFKYGRVPMSLCMGDWIWSRCTAEANTSPRCKVTIMCLSSAHAALALPRSALEPYEAHFHPPPTEADKMPKPHTPNKMLEANKSKAPGHPFVAATFIPRKDGLIEKKTMEEWDYVTRMLFIQKTSKLSKAILNLGPGAANLMKEFPTIDPQRTPKSLTPEEYSLIVKAFCDWPFAPATYINTELDERVDERKRSR